MGMTVTEEQVDVAWDDYMKVVDRCSGEMSKAHDHWAKLKSDYEREMDGV